MNKMVAVFKREYLQAVRKKMFIIMTFLLPFFMAALFVLPGIMVARGMGEKKVAVLDGTGTLHDAFTNVNAAANPDVKKALTGRNRNPDLPSAIKIEYVDRKGDMHLTTTGAKAYLDRMNSKGPDKLDGILVVPPGAFADADAKMTFYSRSATDVITQERLASRANKAIQRQRLSARGISPDVVDTLTADVPTEAVQLTRSGEQKKGGEANLIFGFILAGLLILPSFVYGVEIMRGIIQEKTERVVEVLISSMSPVDLLTGKIVGIAAVGLTQVSVWLIMGALAGTFAAAWATMAGFNIMQMLRPIIFVYFILFFLLAYFTYVTIYAIAGSVCNSDKEAQQLIAPISMVMMLPWFLMFGIITNPDSPLAVGFSMAPVFGPPTMFVRTLISEPPMWQVGVSVLVSLVTILAFFYATAKIFRIGILSYGKRPTLPEIWRWMKVA